jgi:MFS family permease
MGYLALRYYSSFALLVVLCVVLQWYSNKLGSSSAKGRGPSPKFAAFQQNYLIVYCLAMFSDWLQGPYVYQLYVSYGFDTQAIAELFVCGFGSSMIVGTFIGGLADKYGRKKMCMLYAVTYITGCFTKLFPSYWILMIGRFLSGISTSLLFSSFESWMVCEHNKEGFESSLIGDTFSHATFLNGLMAVSAGLVANFVASSFGFVGPFVVAMLPLAACGALVFLTWGENYGNTSEDMMSSLKKGFKLIREDSTVAALGLGQSCFEGAMYTFVFMWTPAMKTVEEAEAEQSHKVLEETTSMYLGLIFSAFMVSVMVGSSVFKIISTSDKVLYKIPLLVHGGAFLCMAITTLCLSSKILVYLSFLVFEGTVGLFYPAYGSIKAEKIPEEVRSAVMNIFRIPLNAFVVLLLLKIKYFSSDVVFSICTLAHGVGLGCYYYFYINNKPGKEVVDPPYKVVPQSDIEMR